MEGMHNSVIKVTSDIVGDVSFNCFVVDINGRNGSDDVVVEFSERNRITEINNLGTVVHTLNAQWSLPFLIISLCLSISLYDLVF